VNELCFSALYRKRSRDLKLVNDGTGFFDRIERFDRSEVRRHSGGVRLVCGFILIVDDEDSRNASIVGVAADRPGSCGERYVGADTCPGTVSRGLR
jgi:hypothetical protein